MTDITTTRRRVIAAAGAGAVFAILPRLGRAATTLRWASVLPATHPDSMMADRVAKQVKEETAGEIDIQVFPNGQLGSSRDSIEAVSSGAIQMVTEGAAQFGQFVPQYSILEAPYILKDAQQLRRVLESPLIGEFNKTLIDKRQMRVLNGTYYGKRHVTAGSKTVKTVADMNGFKLRIPEVDTFRAMAEAWGARPTPMNFNELYLALSQGVVDGQENPLPTIQSGKFNEVQKSLVLTGHIITPRLVAINDSTYQQLGPKGQAALAKALAAQAAWQDAEILKAEAALIDTFKAGGMTVVEPDVESFRKPVLASVPAKFASKWGDGLWERVATI